MMHSDTLIAETLSARWRHGGVSILLSGLTILIWLALPDAVLGL
jgi:hypothetical protein